jgi:hypothetical protein
MRKGAKMKKCEHQETIDLYLLNKLSENEKWKFEDHYFNCSSCFQRTVERHALIETVKNQGAQIFAPEAAHQVVESVPWTEKVLSYLTPRQWVTAAVSAALIIVVVLAVVPRSKQDAPQFVFTGDQTVRGASIDAIAPAGGLSSAPAFIEWKALGEDVEYKVTLSNHKVIWTGTTQDTRIALPEEIRAQMKPGERYSWQVKAYSQKGTLLAVSRVAQFTITEQK